MSKELKHFLVSTIETVETRKRENDEKRNYEAIQTEKISRQIRDRIAEKRQREENKRKLQAISNKQIEKAQFSYIIQRKSVYATVDKLKSEVYSQPELAKVIMDNWRSQGHKIESLSDAFKLIEQKELEHLKKSLSENLEEMQRVRFDALIQQMREEREPDFRELFWSLNNLQKPTEDHTGQILTNVMDQIGRNHTQNQDQIMMLFQNFSPEPQVQPTKIPTKNEQVINEILKIVGVAEKPRRKEKRG